MTQWVLVVDDDPMVGLLVATHLAHVQVRVTGTIADARQQVAGAGEGELLAVVCDHRLPDGDGLELAVEVAAAHGGRVTVAVMSGLLGRDLADRAEAAGLRALDKRDMAGLVDLVPGPGHGHEGQGDAH